jgi:hypothetical protein
MPEDKDIFLRLLTKYDISGKSGIRSKYCGSELLGLESLRFLLPEASSEREYRGKASSYISRQKPVVLNFGVGGESFTIRSNLYLLQRIVRCGRLH